MASALFDCQDLDAARVLQIQSDDGTNRLTRDCIAELMSAIEGFADCPKPLIITGNHKFFSAGADLNEIRALRADAFDFALMGQRLTRQVDQFPAPVCAAVYGYCMGGGLDLALACDMRLAHPQAIFAHRGAALGLITGWGGTQRLPRLIGKARAMEMFLAAEKLTAAKALAIGLIDQIADDPIQAALETLRALPGGWMRPETAKS